MAITAEDRRIDCGDYDITPEQEREMEAMEAASHKEQPAVDTSAEDDMLVALRACQSALAMMIAPGLIKQTSVLNAFVQATEAEAKARAAIAKAAEDRSLEATLATYQQPVGDEEVEKLIASLVIYTDSIQGKNEVSIGLLTCNAAMLDCIALIRRLSTQLRDAQARGKGMEEALKPFAEFMRWSERADGDEVTDWHDNQGVGPRRITFGDLRRARAALSRSAVGDV